MLRFFGLALFRQDFHTQCLNAHSSMQNTVKKYALFILAAILVLPALLINLGVMTFIDDEAIRALVSMEMKLSGNYITPTLHGAFYYNKPPLFNWILGLFFAASGKFDEFTARFPTVLALLGYTVGIFLVFKKRYSWQIGFYAAFTAITCGRILFWDSMLALIDILFSGVVFALFMVVYHFFSKQRWASLFFWVYVLAAFGFLLKGLPALVFTGITLLVYFSYRGEFRRLISGAHVFGIAVFAALVGSYYLLYSQYNGLDTVFQTLVSESSKRTVTAYGIGATVRHFFTFPFEMVYHFFPWSLWVLYFADRKAIQRIRGDQFTEFLFLAFLANVLIYWLSPGIFPRYLLMFIPLVFGVGIRLHEWNKERYNWRFKVVEVALLATSALIAIALWTPTFFSSLDFVAYRIPKAVFLGVMAVALAYFAGYRAKNTILLTILLLLLARIGFDWFVIPARNRSDYGALCRESSLRVGEAYRHKKLVVFGKADMQPANSFYLTKGRGAIIPRVLDTLETKATLDRTALYVIDPYNYPWVSYERQDSFQVRHGKLTYDVGYLNQDLVKGFLQK